MFSAKKVAAVTLVLSFVFTGPAPAQYFGGSSDAAGAQKVLFEAAHALHPLRTNSRFIDLLEKARAVFIVPEMVKDAFGFGASGGTGVLVAHEKGQWSNPAFLTIGSFSFGARAAWEAGPVFIFILSDKTLADFTQVSQLLFYGEAGLTVAAWRANAWVPIGESDIAVWSGENGAYAGLIVGDCDVHDKTIYDKAYYNNKYTEANQIIGSRGDTNAGILLNELPT